MKIEFGGGKSPRKKGWLQCDIQNVDNIDIVCNAWEICDYIENNVIEEIYSRHFLEHTTFIQAEACIRAWYKILKPEGSLQIIIPNLQWHFDQFFHPQRHEIKIKNSSQTLFQRAIQGIYGKQTNGMTDVWDVHKSGWDFETLSNLLLKYNFRNIQRKKDLIKNLNVIAFK
jgi:predicted SAM-dependent methyltransferase